MARRTRRHSAHRRSTRSQATPTRSPLAALFMLPLLPVILSMRILGFALRLSFGTVGVLLGAALHGSAHRGRRSVGRSIGRAANPHWQLDGWGKWHHYR